MRKQVEGKIAVWNDDRGFGFITPVSGGDRVFVHITAIQNRKRPQLNQTVFYTRSQDKDGWPRASGVTYKKHAPHKQGLLPAVLFIGLFFAGLGALIFILQIVPAFILWLYLFVSAITFLTYAVDKSAAENGRWRPPESTLHLMSLLGGWPGALIAQRGLHHKSIKTQFQAVYKFTGILNIAITAWLLTPRGPELTTALLNKLFN
jgi:uncharacterized membrane protein YsdA (DUF1294 family)/cold shock CspA family protein